MIIKRCPDSKTATAGLWIFLALTFALVTVKIEFYTDASVRAHLLAVETDSVWRVLPEVYERLAIPVTTLDPAQRLIGNRGYGARHLEDNPLSRYLDCGRGMGPAYADHYSVTLLVITRLSPATGGSTIIETTIDGSAKPRDVGGSPQHCVSKGRLELRVAELAVEMIENGASADTTSFSTP
jgi:hypothetical protein